MDQMKAFVRVGAETNHVELMEIEIPPIDENEVLVKVQAFGVGIHDRYFIPQNATFPYTIGTEAAGVIVKTGDRVKNYHIGDRVILSSSMQLKGGCWAEYVAVSSDKIIPMVDEMDFTIGAALPVAGKTALESMHALGLKKGDTLFIAGASGAIGTLVIQLAANEGIRVIGSASSKNQAYMKSLGAEQAVDYSNPTWKERVNQWMPGGVDAALAIQPETGADSMDVVKNSGKVITVSGDKVDSERDITVRQFQHQLNMQEVVGDLIQDIVAEKVKVVIERIYPFEEAVKAIEKTETRHARGKLVVSVK